MPLSNAERQELIQYIKSRTCEEFRQGKPCLDREADPPEPLEEPHPGCSYAAQMVELVEKA